MLPTVWPARQGKAFRRGIEQQEVQGSKGPPGREGKRASWVQVSHVGSSAIAFNRGGKEEGEGSRPPNQPRTIHRLHCSSDWAGSMKSAPRRSPQLQYNQYKAEQAPGGWQHCWPFLHWQLPKLHQPVPAQLMPAQHAPAQLSFPRSSFFLIACCPWYTVASIMPLTAHKATAKARKTRVSRDAWHAAAVQWGYCQPAGRRAG